MATPFQNTYHLRKVADTSSKPCTVCYKHTPQVLITPDKKDFFYVCLSHTRDRGFATAVVTATQEETESARKAREEKELEAEVERVKKEFLEKEKRKKEGKGKGKDKEKEGEEEKKKEEKEKGDEEVKDDEEARKKKEKEEEEEKEKEKKNEEPRIFTLHKIVFESRVRRYRQVQLAKLNQDRLRNGAFPSVPTGSP
ncbi:VPS4-associated protein 1 [Tuber borchii]|uniref:VPS4-associated protein 1 n=1 Tax=Tuber borchii TaxID=42251 RepID=A0A2T6ZGY3_TUBBO|nr:VPS4-associated protein 1 [Tuber borchii]